MSEIRENQLIVCSMESKEMKQISNSDFTETFNFIRWFLVTLGVAPLPINSNILKKISSTIISVAICSLIFWLIIPSVLHICLIEKSPKKKLKFIGPMSFCFMALSKYTFLIMKSSRIGKCLCHIESDWRMIKKREDRNIMLNDAKTGHFISNLCAGFMYSGGFFYRTILPFALPKKVLPDNTTLRPLAYPIYRPLLNSQRTPIYELIFMSQWLGGFVMYTITVTACCIAAAFTLHACGQLKIAMSRLDEFVDGDCDRKQIMKKKLMEFVELHLRTLKFISQIEGIMTEICFIEFIGCTANICFIGYYLITELEQGKTSNIALVTYTFLMASFTFNIFVYCYIGELLNQQGRKVGTTVYMIDWYELPGKNATDILLILAMSNNPTILTAGKMAHLSYATFCNVLKTAMAYFNLLRSMIF